MPNLLQETLAILSRHGKSPAYVRWVGHVYPGYLQSINPKEPPLPHGSWGDFEKFADFEYDAGYGGAEVKMDLVIVGDEWWLERGEYDGSEWWEFKSLPQPPKEPLPLRASDLRERTP